MTKKILLKWLDSKQSEAIGAVEQQRAAAKAALNEWKYKTSGFEALVAEICPAINAIYDRVAAWHEEHNAITGPNSGWYGSIQQVLAPLAGTPEHLSDYLRRREFTTVDKDREFETRFNSLRAEVEKTYKNVAININRLPSAKHGIEYLESLGFDLSELKTSEEKPVETALAVPINTQFLLIKEGGNTHDSC